MAEGFSVPAAVPPDFKYLEVLRKGRPEHTLYDSFSLRHPKMPQAKRAKIFAPFAALKGYDEAVAAKELVYTGITRARERLCLSCSLEILGETCMRRVQRESGLPLWLRGEQPRD